MADKPITRLASEMATQEQKKKRGFFDKVGGFFADAGQEVGRMVTNPLETAQRVGSMAKETFVDPIVNLPNAFDPTSGLSPLERVNTGLGGALAVSDMLTPFLPEGALANALAKRAASKAWAESVPNMTKPVGPTAADWFFGKYGLHGSPTQGITQLEPRMGSNAFPDKSVTFAHSLPAVEFDVEQGVKRASTYAPMDGGSVYVAKYPRNAINNTYNDFIISDAPGRVIGEYKMPSGIGSDAAYMARENAPQVGGEQLLSSLLTDVKSPALKRKLVENFGQVARNLALEQARTKAEYAANAVGRRA